jgi:hypothetical protein
VSDKGFARWLSIFSVLVCTACMREHRARIPPAGLLPPELLNVRLGMTVGELQKISPSVIFTPYDGLQVRFADDSLGFETATFFTGDLFPESQPPPSETVKDILLAGDSVIPNIESVVTRALSDVTPTRHCIRRTNSEVLVWAPRPPRAGVELITSQQVPHRVRLRLFSTKWHGTVARDALDQGRCGKMVNVAD